ncbi:MAG: hypothetical protein ACLP5H_33765 [Desulfomonilaceae bacterium]
MRHLKTRDVSAYVWLALGMSDPNGNYSAWEHGLGERILQESSAEGVFWLAEQLAACNNPSEMLGIVYRANVPYLKVSVGSEMAMMLRPFHFWVANARSVWAHLLVKHDFNLSIANEALGYYRVHDRDSEMDYATWRGIYADMEKYFRLLGGTRQHRGSAQRVETSAA